MKAEGFEGLGGGCPYLARHGVHDWGEWSRMHVDMGGVYRFRDCRHCLAEETWRPQDEATVEAWEREWEGGWKRKRKKK